MKLLEKYTTAAERASGCIFAEGFSSLADVYRNGASSVTGTIKRKKMICVGTGALYLMNLEKFIDLGGTIIIRLKQTSSVSSALRFLTYTNLDSSKGFSFAMNSLGGIFIAQILKSAGNYYYTVYKTGYAYKLSNSSHVVVITWDGTSSNKAYIDTDSPLTGVGPGGATLGPDTNDSTLRIGPSTSGLSFTGEIYECKIFVGKVFSQQEVTDYFNRSTYKYMDNAVLDLQMTSNSHDPTNVRTLDSSKHANHATFGDGVTSTTYPTKLTSGRGYSFDGTTDYLLLSDATKVLSNGNPDNFTIAALVRKLGGTDYDYIFYRGSTGALKNFGLAFKDSDEISFFSENAATDVDVNIGTNSSHFGSWNTMIATRSGNNKYLYWNGILVGSNTAVTTYDITNSSLSVGCTVASTGFANMDVGQLLALNKAITPIQVIDLHKKMMQRINK